VGSNSKNIEGGKYIEQLYQHLRSNNIIKKSKDLLDAIIHKTHDKETTIKQLQGMDDLITSTMLKIKRKPVRKKNLYYGPRRSDSLILDYNIGTLESKVHNNESMQIRDYATYWINWMKLGENC
jgi:hypothetical protein